jgi:uncharacterized protein (TIGR04141 family)
MQDEKAGRKIVMFISSQRRGASPLADSYVYGRLTEDAGRSLYLTIGGVIGALARKNLIPSVSEAKKLPIHILDESASETHKCTAFDCFGYECSDKNQVYILASGVWYEVFPDFIGRINATVKKIGKPTLTLPAWNQRDSEAEYKARCALDGNFLNCDRRILHYGGAQSKLNSVICYTRKAKLCFSPKFLRNPPA